MLSLPFNFFLLPNKSLQHFHMKSSPRDVMTDFGYQHYLYSTRPHLDEGGYDFLENFKPFRAFILFPVALPAEERWSKTLVVRYPSSKSCSV